MGIMVNLHSHKLNQFGIKIPKIGNKKGQNLLLALT